VTLISIRDTNTLARSLIAFFNMSIKDHLTPEGNYHIDQYDFDDEIHAMDHLYNLGFCGCGVPDDALEFIGDVLRLMSSESFEVGKMLKLFKSEDNSNGNGMYYFILYQLDQKGLTEHGTSINLSWLTDKGKSLLSDIDEWIANKKIGDEIL